MKCKISIFLMVGLVVSLCSLTTLAQAEEQKAQYYFVEDVAVKTSMFSEYEKAVKEVLALFEEYNFPYPCFTYSTNDYHYYFVYPVEGLSDIDKLFKNWYEIVGKFGEEKWLVISKRMGNTFEYVKYVMCHHLPKLSYAPEGYELNLEETPFTFWGFCYTQPGKEKECEEIIKKFVSLWKSNKDLDMPFDSYVVDMGTEMPMYFYVERGKSPGDHFSKSDKAYEVAGAEIMAIWNELMAHSRKYEYKIGMFRPDLSYIPEEK